MKLGSVDLTTTELTSIKALVESMNSEIEFVSTSSDVTIQSAKEMDIEVSVLENKVPTPEFNTDQEEVNKELEKALDKIFGEEGTEIKTFGHAEETPEQSVEQAEATAEEVQERMETIDEPVVEPVEDIEKFNDTLESANKIEGDELEEIDFNLDDVRKSLRETEKLPTLYIQRTLRSGQSISSDGNIVIIGDANPGSEIIAKGDITVWGILGGIAHAGSAGNNFARIRALKMNAIQLRIADVFARRPDSANIPYIQKTDTFVPEEACIRKKQIFIHKIHE